jgi:dTDP-glucose 4,6-dehydratase
MPDASNRPELVCVLTRGPDRFLARHPEFREIPWLMLHHGDILHPETLPQNARFTHLLHAATDSTLGPQLGLLERYSQIVDGTRHMLDYAVANGISRFLLTSSGGVYGPQPQDMEQIPESYNGMPDPLDAQHAYSVAKRGAEHLCALYRDRHAIETVIARCFAFVGRDLPLDVHFAIGNFIQDAMSAPEITVGGDGTPVRSYMDQRDLAHWLITMLMQGQAGQAYNVGSDAAITISELAYLVRDLLAPNKAVRVLGQANSQNFRNRYVPSISKTRSELALELSYTLAESILETAAAVNCGSIAGT